VNAVWHTASRIRLALLSRVLAAAAGGYGLAAAASIFLSRVLPMPQADAVLAATLISFAVYAAAILWAFAAPSAKAAWLGVLAPAVACVGLSVPWSAT
jgi:hypothetical protein